MVNRTGLTSVSCRFHDADQERPVELCLFGPVRHLPPGPSLDGPARAVKDLVVGSGIDFADQGEHAFKGVPGTRPRWYRAVP